MGLGFDPPNFVVKLNIPVGSPMISGLKGFEIDISQITADNRKTFQVIIEKRVEDFNSHDLDYFMASKNIITNENNKNKKQLLLGSEQYSN